MQVGRLHDNLSASCLTQHLRALVDLKYIRASLSEKQGEEKRGLPAVAQLFPREVFHNHQAPLGKRGRASIIATPCVVVVALGAERFMKLLAQSQL